MTQYKIKVTTLINLIYQLNSLIDSGKHDDITLVEVEREVDNGNIVAWIKNKFADEIDLSLWKTDDDDAFRAATRDMLSVGRIRKYYDVNNRGLPLLIAFTTQMIANAQPSTSLMYTLDT